jgi:NAD(P)-dependent dehydrogenase (short-subunit alcohol dehydrogenase family)
MQSLPAGFNALVIGAQGAIGAALVDALRARPHCGQAIGLHRRSVPPIDIESAASIQAAAAALAAHGPFHLVINATGALHVGGVAPEKRLAELSATTLARSFAINAIAPALLIQQFTPLLPRNERALFASLSARVGSIGDNRLGGWYSYRAAKAAQNQLVHTAAIEVARSRPLAVLAALHPGTVRSPLTAPVIGATAGTAPGQAAAQLLDVLDRLQPADSGGFFAYDGQAIAW